MLTLDFLVPQRRLHEKEAPVRTPRSIPLPREPPRGAPRGSCRSARALQRCLFSGRNPHAPVPPRSPPRLLAGASPERSTQGAAARAPRSPRRPFPLQASGAARPAAAPCAAPRRHRVAERGNGVLPAAAAAAAEQPVPPRGGRSRPARPLPPPLWDMAAARPPCAAARLCLCLCLLGLPRGASAFAPEAAATRRLRTRGVAVGPAGAAGGPGWGSFGRAGPGRWGSRGRPFPSAAAGRAPGASWRDPRRVLGKVGLPPGRRRPYTAPAWSVRRLSRNGARHLKGAFLK